MRALLVASLVALPVLAAAQTARPGVDCHLLTVTQAKGQPCANSPQPDPQAVVPTGDPFVDAACQPTPNPYDEPDRANLCVLMLHRHELQPTAFLPGGIYQDQDPRRTLVVTEIRIEPDARTSVIGRWLRHEDARQAGRLYVVQAIDVFERLDP